MKFLSPSLLWLAGLSIPIVILYLLRVRREPIRVSSVFLWDKIVLENWVDTPWQRLKRNLLLLIQLLILMALVLGLARPAIALPKPASGSVILLLDASASMQATDVLPNRFAAARAEAISILDTLDQDAQAGVVLVGPEPGFIVPMTTDRTGARAALSAATPSSGTADWKTALSLAAGAARGIGGLATLIILSDGGIRNDSLPALPGEVRYVSIGRHGENLAITGLAVRRAPAGSELFVGVTNYGSRPVRAVLAVDFDGSLLTAQQLELQPGENVRAFEKNLPVRSGLYTVRLEPAAGASDPLDVFDLDNRAAIWHQTETSNRILLGSEGNYFLEALISAMPGYAVTQALPDDSNRIGSFGDDFDILILDGLGLSENISANLLWVNPPENALFPVGPLFTPQAGNAVVHPDPRTEFLAWNNINILAAKTVEMPDWAASLVETDGRTLVFAGEIGDRKIAVLTFDLRDSDLPLQVDFPVLFANLLDYLGGPGDGLPTGFTNAGEAVVLPAPIAGETLHVLSPDGAPLAVSQSDSGVVRFIPFQVGVYRVELHGANGRLRTYPIAVNLISAEESSLEPREELSIAGTAVRSSTGDETGYRELTGWLIGAAFILLLVEWLVYQRPQIGDRWPFRAKQRLDTRF